MMKKLLYILLFSITYSSFAQKEVKTQVPKHKISNISIYPNPFSIKTTVTLHSDTDTDINFIVQDLLGNIVFSKEYIVVKGKNAILFYKNKLKSGIYIYTLKTKNKVISKRFVIK